MVMYDYDTNLINATAIKSHKKHDIVDGFDGLYKDLQKARIQPVLHKLDNEYSKDLISSIEEKVLDFQLAPPHDHRQNPAERAIQTFKNHYIATLYGADDEPNQSMGLTY